MALLQWASRLRWLPGQGHVTYVELALDFEAHAARALPAPSDHRLRGVTLPLRTRGQVLKMALDALQPHLQAGDLLQGKEVWMTKSLLPLGGFRCAGRSARPLFAYPAAMLFQMRQLEAHCRELWTRRLARPGRGRQDMFLLDYLPPAGPGRQPLRPFQRLPRRLVQRDRHGAGDGSAGRAAAPPQVALCARHRAPPCAACAQRGAEHCCRRAHEGHRMDAAQARVAARALRAWLQPAPPAGAGPAVASQPVRDPPRGRKRSRSRSSSRERATRRAHPASRECARHPGEPSDPPPRVSMGGAHSLSGSGMLDGRGELRRPLPPPPPSLPPGRAPGQGGAAGGRPQVPQAPAGSPGGRNMGGGGALSPPPSTSPPPSSQGAPTVPRTGGPPSPLPPLALPLPPYPCNPCAVPHAPCPMPAQARPH